MNSGKCLGPLQILPSVFLAVGNFGCGGSSSSQTFPPPPQISVAVSPATATVQTSLTARLTVIVCNDASNSGVSWSVSCSAGQCGTITPPSTPSGTPAIYTAPATMPPNVNVIVTASSVADKTKASSSTLIPVGYIPDYDVGVDYHAYGVDINATGFIAIYNQPQVRQTVQAQLQRMADRGATFIQTAIWVAKGPSNTCCSTAQVTFPMTAQEQANLRAYTQDVAAVTGAAGNRLRLDIALNWLADADFTIGSPATTLGPDNLSPADFAARTQNTTDQILAAVADVTRLDGIKLVDTIFFDSEPNIPAPGEVYGTPNIGWFLTTNYPHFVSTAAQVGIRPSIYFIGCGPQDVVLDNSYVDSVYPILDGHRSVFWVYRGLKFMADNGLPLPSGHTDFDCYIDSSGATYAQLLQRVLDDADATLPSLGAPQFYDVPETYYLADPALRLQYGRTFAGQAAQSPRLQRVSFWTTPGGGPNNEEANSAYPFTIEDFLPPPP